MGLIQAARICDEILGYPWEGAEAMFEISGETVSQTNTTSSIQALLSDDPIETISVRISYEIIRLFSEGLYQSPHKAIEELVSNGYDAVASRVHVLLPEEPEDGVSPQPLWVIDDGRGMDAGGFRQLWRVAYSAKAEASVAAGERPPIGQFGIGKLAAYVLAWELTHLSCVDGKILLTSMDFHTVSGRHQFQDTEPVPLSLHQLDDAKAQEILGDVRARDPAAWELMFGDDRASTWTAAGLSDFKNLYDRLSTGRLRWVLSTGLPLHSEFRIWLNGEQLASSKERFEKIREVKVGDPADTAATKFEQEDEREDEESKRRRFRRNAGGVVILGIDGPIRGIARIFKQRLTTGKSEQYGRSHGFFVRVRGRVINLEDELFGLDALNHAAWSRFSMEIDADGLRDHLLSSREGVRESEAIHSLRKYLHQVFNVCRKAYDEWNDRQIAGLDIEQLLSDAPSLFVTEPLLQGVRHVVETGSESFYISSPQLPPSTQPNDWLGDYEKDISRSPFQKVLFEDTGPHDRALRYIPETRTLMVNTKHPFVDKLITSSRNRGSATLFGSSEVLMDALLQEHGVPRSVIMDFMGDRDRILRLLAGDRPSTATEVLRLLSVANRNETFLERAVGATFRVLGFEYERRGGSKPGPDGVLYARLGRDIESLADYKLVYDAKQTNQPSVPARAIDLNSLEDFRRTEGANFGFFVADAYAAEDDLEGKINRKVTIATTGDDPKPVTLLKLNHLQRIVKLHYRYGVTLTRLRSLFTEAHTVTEAEAWVTELEKELSELEPQVPLKLLLTGIEKAKADKLSRPNVHSVRAVNDILKTFTPERLITALQAVETIVGKRWLEVEKDGDVRIHHNVEQIMTEVERYLHDLLRINTLNHPPST